MLHMYLHVVDRYWYMIKFLAYILKNCLYIYTFYNTYKCLSIGHTYIHTSCLSHIYTCCYITYFHVIHSYIQTYILFFAHIVMLFIHTFIPFIHIIHTYIHTYIYIHIYKFPVNKRFIFVNTYTISEKNMESVRGGGADKKSNGAQWF